MADDSFDPCECMWSHEMAMRRLLSLLRQSQSLCTDNECLEPTSGLPSGQNSPNSFVMMAMCWVAVAFLLFMLRPNSLRNRDDSKPREYGPPGPNGAPPAPPAIN